MDRLDIHRKKEEMGSFNDNDGGRSTIIDHKQPVQRILIEPSVDDTPYKLHPVYLYTSFCDMKP